MGGLGWRSWVATAWRGGISVAGLGCAAIQAQTQASEVAGCVAGAARIVRPAGAVFLGCPGGRATSRSSAMVLAPARVWRPAPHTRMAWPSR